jgi:hypothetical protein
MEVAIKRVEELLPTAKNPQAVAIAGGILADKAAQLEQVVHALEDRRPRLAQAQGEVIAELLRAFCEGLGVPLTPAVRAVMRCLLEQADVGGVLAVSPSHAEAAAAEVLSAMADTSARLELERAQDASEFLQVLPEQTAGELLDGEVEEISSIGEVEETAEVSAVDREAVDVDVVDEPEPERPVPQLWLDAYGGDEVLARGAWWRDEERRLRQGDRDAEVEFFPTRPSVHRAAAGDIFDPDVSSMRPPGGWGNV